MYMNVFACTYSTLWFYDERGGPKIFRYPILLLRKWQKIHSIVGIVFDPVHDVAFAPNLGRYADPNDLFLCA